MKGIELAEKSLQLISKDLGLTETPDLQRSEDPFLLLEQFLTRQIQYLLDHDFGYLLNALYRIDILEEKVKEILELSPPEEIAETLAKNVIKREKEKVAARIWYSL